MILGDGTRESVEAAVERLRERFEEVPVDTLTVENDPDFFEHGVAVAEANKLGGAGAWVTDDEGRALFIRNHHDADTWGVPGGGIEPGETLPETARREVLEETGVEARVVDVWKVRHKTIVHRDDPDRRLHMLDAWFEAVAEDPEICLDPSEWEDHEEIHEARWFAEPPEPVWEPFEERVAEWGGA
jgi:8-oxo-dGTP pyrophosphatase MutT (NUDIX family)